MAPRSLDAIVTIPEDVIFRELEGEAVILNLTTGVYFGLNEVGTRAWMKLAESRSVRMVVVALAEEYDVDRATLEQDVLGLLADLIDKGLVIVDARETSS